ncbi:DUF4232 domain-containing protein [Saccharopolyspora sp. NPDC002686]|uniref:DUF4232 domain-containing protein n=1 Tax=Saccharopolyspora sp. NPDC002686 TaxID=3154541 RepID=UPI003333B6C4
MLLNRTRTLGAAVALVGGVALLSGCAQGATNAPAPEQGTNSATAEQATGETNAKTEAKTEQASDETSSEAACSAGNFKVELNVQPDRPGILLLAATNNSKETCTVNGYPTLVGTDMSGADIDVQAKQVDVPGAPTSFEVAPGQTAFAGVKIETGDKGDSDVKVATGFKVGLPGSPGAVDAEVVTDPSAGGYPEYPIKSIEVGSLQPAAQGVTVF